MSGRPSSVRMEQSAPNVRIFTKFDIWVFLQKYRENSSTIKTQQELRVLYMKTGTHFWSYFAQLILEREIFQTKVVEKIKACILWSVISFRKSRPLWDNMEKYCTAGQAIDEIERMRISCWYRSLHTHTCNYYCFSTATIVAEQSLNVTFTYTLPVMLLLVLLHSSVFRVPSEYADFRMLLKSRSNTANILPTVQMSEWKTLPAHALK